MDMSKIIKVTLTKITQLLLKISNGTRSSQPKILHSYRVLKYQCLQVLKVSTLVRGRNYIPFDSKTNYLGFIQFGLGENLFLGPETTKGYIFKDICRKK